MKLLKIYLFFWSLMLVSQLYAQNPIYQQLNYGEHAIGFANAVVFDSTYTYNQYGYQGETPILLKVWFPVDVKSKELLGIQDVIYPQVSDTLPLFQKELIKHTEQRIYEDAINYNVETGEALNFSPSTAKEVFNDVMHIPTKSQTEKLPQQFNYPVIVYHHGSQSISAENHLLAEYFASHGYVVISGSFHLPYPNTTYGLRPFEVLDRVTDNQSNVKAVVDFATQIAPNQEVYYIGHSWGAQQGWCFLFDNPQVKKFISLETTIEYKRDSTLIKDRWPEVYKSIKTEKNQFGQRILVCAAHDEGINFDFFQNVSTTPPVYASYKEYMEHNAYTSMFFLRYLMNTDVSFVDETYFKTQVAGYVNHIGLMHQFLMTECPMDIGAFDQPFRFY